MSATSTSLRIPTNLHEQLPAWRARLEEERKFLLAQCFIMVVEREEFPTLADNQVTAAQVAATEAAIVEVDEALARMDRGDYGSCLDCGRAINPDRLDVLPMTPRCRPCQRGRRPGHLSRTNQARAHVTEDFHGHSGRAAK